MGQVSPIFIMEQPMTAKNEIHCLENSSSLNITQPKCTLSELMMSFLLIVPTFSDSAPPSSNISRTSAPVAILSPDAKKANTINKLEKLPYKALTYPFQLFPSTASLSVLCLASTCLPFLSFPALFFLQSPSLLPSTNTAFQLPALLNSPTVYCTDRQTDRPVKANSAFQRMLKRTKNQTIQN